MLETNKTLVYRWFEEVWNKRRADAVAEMIAPQGKIHGLGDTLDRASFLTLQAAYLGAFSDLHFTIRNTIAEGNQVAVHWLATGTHDGPLMDIGATGRTVRFEGMAIIRVANGQVVEAWNNYDLFGLRAQLTS